MPRVTIKITQEIRDALNSGKARKLLEAAKVPRKKITARRGLNLQEVVFQFQLSPFIRAVDDVLRKVDIDLEDRDERNAFMDDLGCEIDERVENFKALVESSLETIIKNAIAEEDEFQEEVLQELQASYLELRKANRKLSPIFIRQYRRINFLIATYFL
jgi:tRNA uridine 5-carbamoylmethylation protein Kti12